MIVCSPKFKENIFLLFIAFFPGYFSGTATKIKLGYYDPTYYQPQADILETLQFPGYKGSRRVEGQEGGRWVIKKNGEGLLSDGEALSLNFISVDILSMLWTMDHHCFIKCSLGKLSKKHMRSL